MIVFGEPLRLSGCETAHRQLSNLLSPKGDAITMKTKLTLTLITLAGLILFAGFVRGGNSAAAALETRVNPHYKGASAFNLAGAGPNVARCGA